MPIRRLLPCLALCLGAAVVSTAYADQRLRSPDDFTGYDRTTESHKDSIWVMAWDGSQRRRWIHTPLLFMGGDKDFNVLIAGS